MAVDGQTEQLRGVNVKQILKLNHVTYLKRSSFLGWGERTYRGGGARR
jgi:hypothetical protein